MLGIEKILVRFPKLYSRIGLVHQFKNLSKNEVTFILEKHLGKLNSGAEEDDFNDQELISTVTRITNGGFFNG